MDEQQDPGYYREEKNEQTGATGAKIAGGCGLGCLGLVLLVLAGIAIAVYGAQKQTDKFADQFTTEQPVQFVYPDIQMDELDSILERFDKFLANLEDQQTTEPLILSADEVNILINHHEIFKLVAERVKVEFIDNRIVAEASLAIELPQSIPFITKALEGKYLNGEAEVDLSIHNGQGSLFIRDFQITEAELPKEILDYLSSRNWLEHANLDPQLKTMLDKISELKVENGLLYIIPRDPNSEEPEIEGEAKEKPTTIEA